MLFMVPLALANGTATLVAQRIGAGDLRDAHRLGWHGLAIGALLAGLMGGALYFARAAVVGLYTRDAAVAAAALPLLAWVALFHLADATQTVAAFVLRAWRLATVPLLVNAGALWGVGLFGGYLLAFDRLGVTPAALRGARGFWFAATLGLVLAALALAAILASAPAGAIQIGAGRLSVNTLPPPARGSQRTLPPWRSAIWRTSARPRPTPPSRSACPGRRKKGSKMRSR